MWSYSYQMVWTETSKTYHEMISAEGWTGKKEINIPVVQSLTFKVRQSYFSATAINSDMPQLAVLIIAKCGFGLSFNWLEPPQSTDGKMSIQQALHVVSNHITALMFVPKWLQRLPFSGYVSDRSRFIDMSGLNTQLIFFPFVA